ncbi:hypothetical protein Tco_1199660, partial [Tanacetum coccineum]
YLTIQDRDLETISLGILYTSFTVSSLFASSVVTKLGSKNALLLGTTEALCVDELKNLHDDFMLSLNTEINDGSIEEVQWSLQAVSVPSGGLGLSPMQTQQRKLDSAAWEMEQTMPKFTPRKAQLCVYVFQHNSLAEHLIFYHHSNQLDVGVSNSWITAISWSKFLSDGSPQLLLSTGCSDVWRGYIDDLLKSTKDGHASFSLLKEVTGLAWPYDGRCLYSGSQLRDVSVRR